MENQLKEGLQQSAVQSSAEQSSVQPEKQEKKSRTVLLLGLLFGVVVVGGIAVYIAYAKGEDRKKADDYENVATNGLSEQDSSAEVDGDEEEDEIGENVYDEEEEYICDDGWEVYTDSDVGYRFCYPSDWIVEDQGEEPLGHRMSVNQYQGYNIDFHLYDEEYPYYCIFDDTDTNQLPEDLLGNNKEFSSYREVDGYRVGELDLFGTQVEYVACMQESDGLYNAFIDPVYISYRVPIGETVEEHTLVLDAILASFEKVE